MTPMMVILFNTLSTAKIQTQKQTSPPNLVKYIINCCQVILLYYNTRWASAITMYEGL